MSSIAGILAISIVAAPATPILVHTAETLNENTRTVLDVTGKSP